MKFINEITNELEEIEFNNKKINIILGRNGTGKTNLLRSLGYVKNIDDSDKEFEIISIHKDSRLSEFLGILPNKMKKLNLKTSKGIFPKIQGNNVQAKTTLDLKALKNKINNIDQLDYAQLQYFDGGFKFNSGPGEGNEKFLILKILKDHLFRKQKKTLILIDEPENHLHPDLVKDYTKILKEISSYKNTIVVIATHSEQFTRYLFPEAEIYVATRNKGKFECKKINFNVDDFIQNSKTTKKFKVNNQEKIYLDYLIDKHLSLSKSKNKLEYLKKELHSLLPEIIISLAFSNKVLLGEGSIEKNIENYMDVKVIQTWGKAIMPFYIFAINKLSHNFEKLTLAIIYDKDIPHGKDKSQKEKHLLMNLAIEEFTDHRKNKIHFFDHNIECHVWSGCYGRNKKKREIDSRNGKKFKKFIETEIETLF